eukprot:12902911-Prorocentrum_lima.AAC.1
MSHSAPHHTTPPHPLALPHQSTRPPMFPARSLSPLPPALVWAGEHPTPDDAALTKRSLVKRHRWLSSA